MALELDILPQSISQKSSIYNPAADGKGKAMRRWWKILETWRFSFLAMGGNASAVVLVFARHAQVALLLAASLPVFAGLVQSRLAQQRTGQGHLCQLRQELQAERGIGRLCLLAGFVAFLTALFLPPFTAVIASAVLTGLISLRVISVLADSAIKEEKLEIGTLSAAEECSCIERWARRLITLPGRLGKYLARVARNTAPMGELTRLRALPIALMAASVLVFGVIGGALAAQKAMDGSDTGLQSVGKEPEVGPHDSGEGEEDEKTYADLCPQLPDPLTIGHGLGHLFRYDGGFKAGCGGEATEVAETGVWFATGMCHGELRSLAVAPPHGDAVLLYGSGAKFAWQAALRGDLVSAEAARPAGGDVYSIETFAGAYGFARPAPTGTSNPDKPNDCTDVTSTDRPFAELSPPMVLEWRNLVEYKASWSWPLREDSAGDSLAFAEYPSGIIAARGHCDSDFSCYLDVGGFTWPGEGTAYVSLDELKSYMPPEVK